MTTTVELTYEDDRETWLMLEMKTIPRIGEHFAYSWYVEDHMENHMSGQIIGVEWHMEIHERSSDGSSLDHMTVAVVILRRDHPRA